MTEKERNSLIDAWHKRQADIRRDKAMLASWDRQSKKIRPREELMAKALHRTHDMARFLRGDKDEARNI